MSLERRETPKLMSKRVVWVQDEPTQEALRVPKGKDYHGLSGLATIERYDNGVQQLVMRNRPDRDYHYQIERITDDGKIVLAGEAGKTIGNLKIVRENSDPNFDKLTNIERS